jgi:hypothetical protein
LIDLSHAAFFGWSHDKISVEQLEYFQNSHVQSEMQVNSKATNESNDEAGLDQMKEGLLQATLGSIE